jgi:predicted enzyme related to lactoylglutathione lyase
VDQPYYVAFNVAGQDVGLDPGSHHAGLNGPVIYWTVDDIRASLKALLEAGADLQQDVKDVGGGRLTARVKDTAGNVVGLSQPG